jgi:hypothetical protein
MSAPRSARDTFLVVRMRFLDSAKTLRRHALLWKGYVRTRHPRLHVLAPQLRFLGVLLADGTGREDHLDR